MQPVDSQCVGLYRHLSAVFPGAEQNNVDCKTQSGELSEDFITSRQTTLAALVYHFLSEITAVF